MAGKTFTSLVTANGGLTLGPSQALSLSGSGGTIASGSSITASASFGDGSGLSRVTAAQIAAANVLAGSLGSDVIASSVAVDAINSDSQIAAGINFSFS